jgi:hypothetical protein
MVEARLCLHLHLHLRDERVQDFFSNTDIVNLDPWCYSLSPNAPYYKPTSMVAQLKDILFMFGPNEVPAVLEQGHWPRDESSRLVNSKDLEELRGSGY